MASKNDSTVSWFSPLPPDATGVAEFASVVLPSIARLGPIRVWRMPRHRRTAFSIPISASDAVVGTDHWPKADCAVYNVGNSIFHIAATVLALTRPGIVILHDTRLRDLAAHIRGIPGVLSPSACAADEEQCAHHLLRALAERSLAVIVHSGTAATSLAGFACRVVRLNLPFRLSNATNDWSKKNCWWPYTRELGSATDYSRPPARPLSLVIFGHLGPNRRIDSIIQAIAGMPQRQSFRLDIYGRGMSSTSLALIHAAKLSKIVRVHGPVPDYRLDAALANADLGFNLRLPSMGESSLSQLRFWSHSVPTVCTASRTECDDTRNSFTWYVSEDSEIADIRNVLAALLADQQQFRKSGEAARQHLGAHHSPDEYARGMADVIRAVWPTGWAASN